jgi:hypothetical protein
MRIALAVVHLLFLPLAAGADTLSDLKVAVSALHGTHPVEASVEMQRTRKSTGRFVNQESVGSATINISSDPEGLRISVPKALLDRAGRETREHQVDTKRPASTRDTLDDLDAVALAENVDFSDAFLRLVALGSPVSEKRVTFQGKPARMMVMKVTEPTREATTMFHVNFSDDRLTIWVGDNNLPVAAERQQKGSAGFLFIRGEMSSRHLWNFSRRDDRLIVLRYEMTFLGSGFGQRGEGKTVETITLR